jgi:hypothetical protein
MATNKYILDIKTRGAKASKKAIGGVGSSLGGLAKKMALVGGAYFGGKALISGIKASTEAFGQQELAEKKLATALGFTSEKLLEQARALQQTTKFGDEDIIMMQSMLGAFTDNEDEIAKLTEATLDLASGMGMDLKSAGDLVAKTIGSSTNALSRYGIEVKGAVGSTERLENLTGNVANLFGGQAKAQAETFSGSVQQMKNAIGDLGEKFGSELAPALTKSAQWIKRFAEKGGEFVGKLFDIDWGASVSNLFNNLGVIGQAILDTMSEIFDSSAFRGIFGKIWKAIKWAFKTAVDGIIAIAEFIFEPLINAGKKMGNEIANFFIRAMNKMKRGANKIIKWLGMKKFKMTPEISTEGLDFADSKMGAFFKKQADDQVNSNKDLTSKVKGIWSEALGGIVEVSQEEGSKIQSNLDPNIIMGGSEDGTSVEENLGETKEKWEANFSSISELAGQFTSSISTIYGSLFDMKKSKLDADQKEEIKAIENSTMSEESKKKKIEKINEKYKKKELEEKKKLLPVKLADATSSIALGIAKALSSAPPPFNIALAGLTATAGALQLATISASQYARGGLVTGNPHSMGGKNINAEGGEFVMSRDAVNRIGLSELVNMNRGGSAKSVVVNITAPLVDESVVEHIIPAINRALNEEISSLDIR